MPNDKTAGAPGEEQDGAGMFRWELRPHGVEMRAKSGRVTGRAVLPPYPEATWEAWVDVNGLAILVGRRESIGLATAEVEAWWRAAAKTPKELGL